MSCRRVPVARLGVWLLFAMGLLPAVPAMAQQPIPGSEGWLLTPTLQGQKNASQKIGKLDRALTRCLREAIATGQFFLGDVTYVLGRCQQPLNAWVDGCQHREGHGAPICLLGPEAAAGELLRDAWDHRNDLRGWLASLPPLPETAPGRD